MDTNSNVLGVILILLGCLVLMLALGEFIFRLMLTLFGFYLIFSGLRLRNQHQQIFFFCNRFGSRFNKDER